MLSERYTNVSVSYIDYRNETYPESHWGSTSDTASPSLAEISRKRRLYCVLLGMSSFEMRNLLYFFNLDITKAVLKNLLLYLDKFKKKSETGIGREQTHGH